MTVGFDIKANLRENLGSAESRRALKAGLIPAIICDKKGENTYVTVNAREMEKEYFKGNLLSTVVNFDLDGKKVKAIANKVDLHPVSDRPVHINFIKFENGEKVKAKVKTKFINKDKSRGIKKGGFLNIVLRKIELLCDADAIPDIIEIDIKNMRVGDKVRTTDLKLPEGVVVANKRSATIASITGRGTKDNDDDGAPTEAGESAEAGEEKDSE
ncbi:MAG: 50S ribosomal protein L25/general stress protein Ctc [Proteobacteria bacterium]|nr:50S ribosomal protein L25/general stress protein Ctc [Pseudomonadota bacterium]